MGLDLWFREDVARILASAHETVQASMGASAPTSPELADAYQRGFVDALRAVAVAFGIAVPSRADPGPTVRPLWDVGAGSQRSGQGPIRSLYAPGRR